MRYSTLLEQDNVDWCIEMYRNDKSIHWLNYSK